MVQIRFSRSDNLTFSICSTLPWSNLSRLWKNRFQVPVVRKWQIASRGLVF